MIQHTFDYDADAAAARYGLMLDAWQSHFSASLNDIDFGSTYHTERLVGVATDIANSYLMAETELVKEAVFKIAREARQTTLREISSKDTEDMPERTFEHLVESHQYLINAIVAQVNRDIASMRETVRRVALEVYAASRSRGISQRSAVLEYLIGNSKPLDFSFLDRGGRRWPSRRYVRTLWRQSLLSAYNEVVMLTLADHGLRRARVVHVDPAAEVHNQIIAFSSASEHPTYSEIRDTVFHPNANAVLAMENTDVST